MAACRPSRGSRLRCSNTVRCARPPLPQASSTPPMLCRCLCPRGALSSFIRSCPMPPSRTGAQGSAGASIYATTSPASPRVGATSPASSPARAPRPTQNCGTGATGGRCGKRPERVWQRRPISTFTVGLRMARSVLKRPEPRQAPRPA